MNLVVVIAGIIPQLALPFIILTFVGAGLRLQLVRSFAQGVLLGKLGPVLGIGLVLTILGTFNLQPQTQVQTGLDIAYESVMYPYVMNPSSSVMYTLIVSPYDNVVERLNDYMIFAAGKASTAWNKFRALIAIQFSGAVGKPFRFAPAEVSWKFLYELLKGTSSNLVLTITSLAEGLRIAFDFLVLDLFLRCFEDIDSFLLPGLLGDYTLALVDTLICFGELLNDLVYSLLTVTIISEDCEMCRLAQGRTCTFVGRNINLGLFVIEASCPSGTESLSEPFCYQFIERLINCTAKFAINAIPIGIVVVLVADAIGGNIGSQFRQWVFDLERALSCILNLWKTPAFLFLSVVDNFLNVLTRGLLGAPCVNSIGAILKILIGWIFTDPGRSIFNCLGRLLSALTLGAFDDLIDLLFRNLLPFIIAIIDVAERLLGCYILDSAISEILFSFPGGIFFSMLGQPLNGPGRCRLSNNFLGLNLQLPFIGNRGLQTYLLAAGECVCDEDVGEVPFGLRFTLCQRILGETILTISTVALGIILDTVLCTLMPVVNAGTLVAPELFKLIVRLGNIIGEVLQMLDPARFGSGGDVFCRLLQTMFDLLYLLDEFFTLASTPGLFRGARFTWFGVFNILRWLLLVLVVFFNVLMAIIQTVFIIIQQACETINKVIDGLNTVLAAVDRLKKTFKDIGKGVSGAGNELNPFNWKKPSIPGLFKRSSGKRVVIPEITCAFSRVRAAPCKIKKPDFDFPSDVVRKRAEPQSPASVPVFEDAATQRMMFNFSRHECLRSFDGRFNCALMHVAVPVDDYARIQRRLGARRDGLESAYEQFFRRSASDWTSADQYLIEAADQTDHLWRGCVSHDSPARESSLYRTTESDRMRAMMSSLMHARRIDRAHHQAEDELPLRRREAPSYDQYEGAYHEDPMTPPPPKYVYMNEEQYERFVMSGEAEDNGENVHMVHYFRRFSDELEEEMREMNVSGKQTIEKIVRVFWHKQLIEDGLLPAAFIDYMGNETLLALSDADSVAEKYAAKADKFVADSDDGHISVCTRLIQHHPPVLVMNGTEVIGNGGPTDSVGYLFCLLLYTMTIETRRLTDNVTCSRPDECMTLWGMLNNVIPLVLAHQFELGTDSLERERERIFEKWKHRIWEEGDEVHQEQREAERMDQEHGVGGQERKRSQSDGDNDITFKVLREHIYNAPRTGAELVRQVRERQRLLGIPSYRELKQMEARGDPFPWELYKDRIFADLVDDDDDDGDGDVLDKRSFAKRATSPKMQMALSPLSRSFYNHSLEPRSAEGAPTYARRTIGEMLLSNWGSPDPNEAAPVRNGGVIMPSLLNTRRPWHFVHEALLTASAMIQRQFGTAVAARVLNKAAGLESSHPEKTVAFEEGDTFTEAFYTAALDLAYAVTQSRVFQLTLAGTDHLRRMPTNAELDVLAAHPEVQEALGGLEGGLRARMALRSARLYAVDQVTVSTANAFDRHLSSWEQLCEMVSSGMDESARLERRTKVLEEHNAGYPGLEGRSSGAVVRHPERKRNFLERTMGVGPSISAEDAVSHMMQLAQGELAPHFTGMDRFTRDWLYGPPSDGGGLQSRREAYLIDNGLRIRDLAVEAIGGASYRMRTLRDAAVGMAEAAGAQHTPIVQRGMLMLDAMHGKISNEQMWCMVRGECGYVAGEGVVSADEWERSQAQIPLNERSVLHQAEAMGLGEMLWPSVPLLQQVRQRRRRVQSGGCCGGGEEEEVLNRRYQRPDLFAPGIHQTPLSEAHRMSTARQHAKLELERANQRQMRLQDGPFFWEFFGSEGMVFDYTVNHDDNDTVRLARAELIGNWSISHAIDAAVERQRDADQYGRRLLTSEQVRRMHLSGNGSLPPLYDRDGRYVMQGSADGRPRPVVGGRALARTFDANLLVVQYFLQPLLEYIFQPVGGAGGLLRFIEGLPESVIGPQAQQFYEQLFTERLPDYFKGLAVCRRPLNYNGTGPYSPFCLPLLPEQLFDDVLAPTIPNRLVKMQLPWADELVARNCRKVATTRNTNNRRSVNNLFTFKLQNQCGALELTSDLPAAIQECCSQRGLCDRQRGSTLNAEPAVRCLREVCLATPGCALVPNCGFADNVEIGPGVRAVGLDCTMATAQVGCVRACCEDGAQLCNTSDPSSLMRGDALRCLRFCCNGYATFGGLCDPEQGCPGSGDCQNLCVSGFVPGPSPAVQPVLPQPCNLFPECPTWDYCQRLYLSCTEAGYSDVLDVLLYITGVIPFAVEQFVNGAISVDTVTFVLLTITFVVVFGLMISTGVMGIALALPVFAGVSVVVLAFIWVLSRTFPVNDGSSVPVSILFSSALLIVFYFPVIGKVVRTALPAPLSKLLAGYIFFGAVIYIMPSFDVKDFLNLNGFLLSALTRLDRLAIISRNLNLEPLIQRLQDFDYVAFNEVPSFHTYCNLWAWEGWGLLSTTAALSPVVAALSVWALSIVQAAVAFVAAYFGVYISTWLFFQQQGAQETADDVNVLNERIGNLEGRQSRVAAARAPPPLSEMDGGGLLRSVNMLTRPKRPVVLFARRRRRRPLEDV